MAKTTMTYSDWRDYRKKNATNQIAQLSQQGTVNNGGTTANTTITYSDWRDYKKASQVDQNYIDSFFTDVKKFVYSSEEEYQGVRWKNASGIYKVKKTTADDLASRSKNIRSWLELNKDKLKEDDYTNLSSYLDSYDKSAKSILGAFKKAKDHYSKWETEAEYKEAEKATEEHNKKANLDIDVAQKEIDDLEGLLRKVKSNTSGTTHEAANSPSSSTSGSPSSSTAHEAASPPSSSSSSTSSTEPVAGDKYIKELKAKGYSSVEELENDIANKKTYLTQAKRIQESIKFTAVADPESDLYDPDFEKYSVYVDNSEIPAIPNYEDIIYHIINKNEKGLEKLAVAQSWGKISDYEYERLMNAYDHMEDIERQTYNYYHNHVSHEAAERYYDSIEDTINLRASEKLVEWAGANDFHGILFSFQAGIDQANTGLYNLFHEKDYYAPSATQYASAEVRENLEGGWGVAYDVGSAIGNMIPSIIVSAATPIGGQALGAVTLGASASGNAYAEAINAGYDKDQARSYAFMVGASEAGLQYLLGGIGKFGGKFTGKFGTKIATKLVSNVNNAYAKMAISGGAKLVTNLVSEFGEEYLQEVLTPVFKNAAFGTNEEVKIVSSEALYAGFLGALTAGFLEGKGTVKAEVGTYKLGQSVQASGKTGDLAKLGMTYSPDTVAYQIASKVDENTDAYTLGQLLREAGADSLTDSNMAEIQKSLIRKGVTPQNAQTIAKWLNKAVEGRYFTNSQIEALASNEVIAATFRDVILNQKSTVNQRVQGYQDIVQSIEQGKTSPTETASAPTETTKTQAGLVSFSEEDIENLTKEYEANGLPHEQAKALAVAQLADAGAVQSSPTAETAAESKYEVADDGKTTNIKTGKEVKVNNIESISSKGEANLTLDDGMVVSASDIAFSTPAEAMFIETIGAMKLGKNPISVSSANALYQNAMTALKVNPKMTASEAFSLIKGLEESYVFGAYNFSRSELSARNEDGTAKRYAGELSQSQRASAYELGKKDSISKADAEQKAIDEKVGKTKPQASKKTSGKIVYEGGINVDKKSLTKTQQAHLEGIKLLAALTNYEIHVFKSEKVGKTYKYTMPDGTVVSANGWYRVGTNEIWIDLNAGNFGEGIMLETAGHEIGHDIKRKSPKQWKAIADLVMKTFAENNVDTEAMLKKQAKKVKRKYEASNKDMPSEAQILDEAYEEMVCDALSGMLIDGSIVNFIAEVKAKDKNLAQRILDAIKNLLAKWGLIIDDYKGRKLSAPEAQALAQFEDAFKQIQALYRDALMDTDAVNAALQKNTTDDGDVKFMERFEEDKYYSRQIDKWDSLKDGSYIKVGNIKENSPLNTVGMPSGNLYFDVTKIKTELEKHGDHLTTDTLKDIPKLLANPIAITEYNPGKGTNTVSVYGNLYYNGVPVVVGIVATLGRGNNIITKIRTTHARGDFRTQITDDSILYLNENKKETNSWFQAQEHHVPMGGNKYGFIRSITLVDQNVKENSENLFSERDTDIETQINQSMTMDEAKQMVQRAFVLGGIQEWYDGEYKNGDEWLKAQGADEVALYIENEYALQEKYLNKIQGIINDEFYVADVLEAYLEGTLIGKEKPKAKRLDVSVNHRVNDTRFYSPQRIENIKQLFDVATQKLTAKNRAEVTSARAKVLLFAHNSGASELLGLSQAELNKKLRSWSGYSAGAREASERLNRGVADSNKWTGIENCSWLYKNQVTTEELESLVKNVEGAASDYEKLYIARTMLALDTHIDWSWLSFKFDTFANVNKKQVGIGRCNGFYRNDERKIVVSHNKPHTVAHEMGHALDYQWGRDLGFSNSALTDTYRNTERITDADTKQFFDNFKIFLDSLTDNGDIRSEYTQDPKEVFARFVARFVQWVDNTGGNRTYNTETDYYNDKFTASNYIEFVKLLQEKAMLDAKKMENETNENVLFSDRDSEGNQLSEGQQEYFKDSKVRDANGNLLVMYHGTDSYNEFTVFKKGKSGYLGSGIYLTSDKSYAERYAKKNGYDGRVYKTYVNITNPLVVTTDQPAVEILGEKVAQKRGLKNSFSTTWITPSDIKKLQNKGYDGIVWEYAGSVEVSVWDSNQVKNTTNLDPTSNPDIRYSERDSQGHKLSEEQVEFFKDSKIRDEKGRLLAVYHGTKSAGFTRFTKTDEIGYFFARSLKTAQTYSNNSKVVYTPDRYTDTDVPNEANYQVYLNIKKPYIIDGKGANWNGLESTGEKVHLSIKTSYWGDDGKGLGKIVFKYGGKTYSKIVHNVNEFDLFISKHTNPQLAFACAIEMNAIADKNGKGKFEVDLIWDFKKRGNADSKNTRDIVRRAYNSEWDYDGVIFKNVVDSGNGTKIKADDLYVAFNSNQIKSTANTEPTSNPDIRYSGRDLAPTFYSQMGKVVEGVKQEKLAANSVVNMLRGKGVKSEEIRWSGIVPFLEGKKSVTKQELLDFINGSMLQIGEQMSDAVDIEVISEDGDNYIVRHKGTRETLDEWEWDDDVEDGLEGWVNQDGEIALTVDEIREKSFKEFSSTRWSEYKLNGGENYREIVFTMPNSSYSNQMMRVHWGDEAEGVLVHARIQDFDVNGKKMLFIEEIQSDWHNEGHKVGYAKNLLQAESKRIAEIDKMQASLVEQMQKKYQKGDIDGAMKLHEQERELYLERQKIEGNKDGTPDAPFKENYHEYVLKRLLRMAAEQGYDSIGWTPSEVQVERWSDEYAEGYRIEYDQDMPKFLKKYGKQWGASVGTTTLPNGTEVWSMDITDSMKSSVLYEGQALYQERDPESSTRYILANSLESAAQNDVERRKLAEYKEKIALIEAEEGKLAEIQKRLFTKGEVDPTERKALQFEAKQLSNRINTYDRQLLNLEATTALKNVLNREKALAAKRQKQKDNEALKKYKEKVAETQRELMNRYQDSRKRATESRHKTEMRHKIQKVVSELNQLLLKGSKERNVKLGLQDSVAKALEAINMDTVGADERVAKYNDLIAKAKDPDVIASLTETRDRIAAQGDRLSDKLEAMRKAYAEIRNNSKEYAPYYQQEAQLIEAAIEKVIDKVGDTSIRNMTLEQLEAVYDMYKVVLQTIRYANELHNEGKVEELRDNASAMMTELEKIKTLKEERAAIGDLIRGFTWNEMTPVYAIRRTGSKTLEKFYWEMIRGQNTYAQDLDEADEFKAAIREKYGHSKWNLNKVYGFELKDGRTFRLTLEHMMSIYAYSKRPQAIDHMSVGGFFFNDKATFRRKGGLLKMIKSNEAGYTVDVEMLNTIKDEMEKVAKGSTKYVDEMQDYLTKMGNKGNEVSRVVWGIDIFKEKIYFPLKSVKDFIFQANQPSQETSLKHDGMTKETKPGASNPIVLESFDDVWAGHVERMSQYHGFVIPIDNMNKLLNYGSWAGTDSISVSTMLRARFGDAVNEYFNQFIKDMNGASSASGAKNPFFSMVGKFKKTAVAASMSVVAQQPTAILRAAAVLDSRYFIGLPEAHLLSTKWSELKRYAPIAIIKDIGGFDAGGGRQVAEWLNSDARRGADKVLGKIDDITMWGAAVGDQVGWCAIWEAVKRETKAKHKDLEVGSEAFLKIAGERFTEVIVLTQVYDSTLSRSGYMRSKHDSVKMLTAFMGEPTVSINMQFDALLQAKRGTITKRKAGRILGATYAATIAASIAASLIYALRDDDEDESYLEKFAEAFGEKLIGDINPLNQLPAVRDIISIFEGWDVERTDMAVFKDIKDAFDGLFSENKSTWRKVEDFAGAVASIFGVPLKNLLRTGREIYNGYNDIFDGIEPKDVDDAFVRGIKGEKKDKSKALYDAIVSGDEARIEVYRSQYEDDKAYETALRKSLRENDPRIKEAAEARSKGNVDKYMRIVKDIKGERNFSQDTIVAAINAEINSMKPKSKSEISSPAYITVDDYYNSIVNGDTSTARTIKDKLVAEKVEQGYLQSEAEDSIATSFTSQVKSEYMDGNIKRSKAVDLINEYGNSESGAETEIKKCDFELEYGFSWSERARAYRLGKISASELKYAVMDIEGEDWQGAEDYIKFLNLEMANPNLDITASDAKGYFEYAEPAGINIEVYLSYKEKTSGLQGDKDANGKTISGSKKNKVLAVINSLPITYAQKDALYYMNGWSAKTINEAPWH